MSFQSVTSPLGNPPAHKPSASHTFSNPSLNHTTPTYPSPTTIRIPAPRQEPYFPPSPPPPTRFIFSSFNHPSYFKPQALLHIFNTPLIKSNYPDRALLIPHRKSHFISPILVLTVSYFFVFYKREILSREFLFTFLRAPYKIRTIPTPPSSSLQKSPLYPPLFYSPAPPPRHPLTPSTSSPSTPKFTTKHQQPRPHSPITCPSPLVI